MERPIFRDYETAYIPGLWKGLYSGTMERLIFREHGKVYDQVLRNKLTLKVFVVSQEHYSQNLNYSPNTHAWIFLLILCLFITM